MPYTSLFDPELKGGNLAAKYDVIILPSDNPGTLVGRGGGPAGGAVAAAAAGSADSAAVAVVAVRAHRRA